MALIRDQEREYLARLEGMGVARVRSELEGGKIPPHFMHLTSTWLSAKQKEAEERREASNAAQVELARKASEAAERAATAARRANRRATIALVFAVISVIAAAIGIAANFAIGDIIPGAFGDKIQDTLQDVLED
jgi:ferric-dicitrate binding protein FerR (iron transport regulator)